MNVKNTKINENPLKEAQKIIIQGIDPKLLSVARQFNRDLLGIHQQIPAVNFIELLALPKVLEQQFRLQKIENPFAEFFQQTEDIGRNVFKELFNNEQIQIYEQLGKIKASDISAAFTDYFRSIQFNAQDYLFPQNPLVDEIFRNIEAQKIDIRPYSDLPIAEFIEALKGKDPSEYLSTLQSRFPSASQSSDVVIEHSNSVSVIAFIRRIIKIWFNVWTFLAFFFPSLSPSELWDYSDKVVIEYIKDQITGCQDAEAENILRNIICHDQNNEPKDNCADTKKLPGADSGISEKCDASVIGNTQPDHDDRGQPKQACTDKNERTRKLRIKPNDEQRNGCV